MSSLACPLTPRGAHPGETTLATLIQMLRRAVVLGGGGVTGVAWEVGLLLGLAEAGVDLGTAELFVGTSAGSVVAAQVASGVPLGEMFARQVESASGEIGARLGWTYGMRLLWPWLRAGGNPQRFRTRVGALARAARTVPEEDRRAVIAARLPVHEWPDRPLLITAVDATDGTFVVFDRDAGVPLVDAVAASCAVPLVWPPVTVGSRRFVDGGMRSTANADLAAGFDTIVIVAPLARGGGPIRGPRSQADALRAQGARVVLVTPDADSVAAIGSNLLDPSRRTPSAHAGRQQGGAAAAEVSAVWS
jgi:NTE family protein